MQGRLLSLRSACVQGRYRIGYGCTALENALRVGVGVREVVLRQRVGREEGLRLQELVELRRLDVRLNLEDLDVLERVVGQLEQIVVRIEGGGVSQGGLLRVVERGTRLKEVGIYGVGMGKGEMCEVVGCVGDRLEVLEWGVVRGEELVFVAVVLKMVGVCGRLRELGVWFEGVEGGKGVGREVERAVEWLRRRRWGLVVRGAGEDERAWGGGAG